MKIYIGGISPEVNEGELLDLYSQYGKVRKVDLLKDETGTNRGYAFVEMDDNQAAESAILGTNNTLLGTSNIQVSISRSRLDQKRERQKRAKSTGKFRGKPRSNNSRPQRGYDRDNYEQGEDDKYNRIDRNNIKKGVDYGRNNTGNSPQMSFLGQEGFATSIRTVDPVYGANKNTRNNENSNSYRSPKRGRNNFNKGRRSNYPKKYDNKEEKGKPGNNSIFQPNTSDIIGNLE